MQKQCIGFYDDDNRLNVWPLRECLVYPGGPGETVYSRDGAYVLVPLWSADGLARWLSPMQAVELIAVGGSIPPDDLLEFVGLKTRKSGNSTSKRKRRCKPKSPPGSHGLRAFNSKRLADSRGTHERRKPDSHPTHEGNH